MGERYWSPDHPVLEVLRARRDRNDRPGARGDKHKIGLVIQGGGLRGVVSGAMLAALEDLGFQHAFDAIYGTSSGAINGAYFYGGDLWRGLGVYWDYMTTKDFVDIRRFFRGGNALNLDYAFNKVVGEVVPFDSDAVLKSNIPLNIVMTQVDELRTIVVSDFHDRDDLLSALRASSWLPLAVRGTGTFRGQRTLDGFVLTVHPYRFAIADDCTHVLSLSSRPIGPFGGGPFAALGRWVMDIALDRIQRGLGKGHAVASREYREDRQKLFDSSASGTGPPYVLDLALLPWMPVLKSLESDRGKLILGARYAYELAICAAEGMDPAALKSGIYHATPRFTLLPEGPMRSPMGVPTSDLIEP